MSMLISDSHCEGCKWFKFNGQRHTAKDNNKQGYCPFVRCVKRYGFTAENKRRSRK